MLAALKQRLNLEPAWNSLPWLVSLFRRCSVRCLLPAIVWSAPPETRQPNADLRRELFLRLGFHWVGCRFGLEFQRTEKRRILATYILCLVTMLSAQSSQPGK